MNDRYTQYLMDKYGTAWWKMNESSGNVLDSKNGFIGTPYNLTYQIEESISFNGTSSYVQFADKVIPIGKRSIYFEIKKVVKPINPEIIMTQTMGSVYNGTQINFGTDGRLVFVIGKGIAGSPIVSVGTPFTFDGQWHKVLITWDGTTNTNGIKIYVDDMVNPVATTTATTTETLTPSYNLSVGRGHDTANRFYFQGQLKNIQIYNDIIDPLYRFSLIDFDNKLHTCEDNEFIEIEPTKSNFEDYGLIDLSVLTTPTDMVVVTMDEGNIVGEGKEFKKSFNMVDFKNKYGEIKTIKEI